MITTDFTDKVAFITGAGVGIGRATALAFAEAGADVALVSIDEDDLNETARLVRDTGRRAHPIVADVSDASAVQAAVSTSRSTTPASNSRRHRSMRPARTTGTASSRSTSPVSSSR